MLHCATTRSQHDLYRRRVQKLSETAHQSFINAPTSENSIQRLLQFFHGKCLDRLGGWPGFEDARFLRERVEAFSCWSGGLLLQLQIQHPCEVELSVLFD